MDHRWRHVKARGANNTGTEESGLWHPGGLCLDASKGCSTELKAGVLEAAKRAKQQTSTAA